MLDGVLDERLKQEAAAGAASSQSGRDVPAEARATRGGAPRGSARSDAATRSACRAAAARSSSWTASRSRSPRHTSSRRASRGSSVTSPAMALSVLSRKCGSRCARSRASSASLRSCCASRCADARALDGEREDEGQRPQPEVHLRVEDAEEREAQQDDLRAAGREVQPQIRHAQCNEAVQDAEDDPGAHRDALADEQPLPCPRAPAERPGEGRRHRHHQQRQLARHEDEAREDARGVVTGDEVRHALQQHHTEHDGDPEGAPRSHGHIDRGGRGRSVVRRRAAACSDLVVRAGERGNARCSHGFFSVQRGRPKGASRRSEDGCASSVESDGSSLAISLAGS